MARRVLRDPDGPSRPGSPASSSARRCASVSPNCAQRFPARYPIRHYPDITHIAARAVSRAAIGIWPSQATLNREPINPRPLDQAAIFRRTQPHTIGFITYSEGCNDDVNKFVWSGLGWDPKADVTEILRDYGRYFIGAGLGRAFRARPARARAQLARAAARPTTAWTARSRSSRQMDRADAARSAHNWRFQQALYRAYYDAYNARAPAP